MTDPIAVRTVVAGLRQVVLLRQHHFPARPGVLGLVAFLQVLMDELGLDRVEHLLDARFPNATNGPRVIPFSRIYKVASVAADLAAGRI